MVGDLSATRSRNWAERMYQHYLPVAEHLPTANRRSWVYFKLWPNFAFDVYPDQVDIMQWIPVSPTQTLIREIGYSRPDARREMRVARYCNWRVNRQVNEEDRVLIERENGMATGSYQMAPAGGRWSRCAVGRMRALIPAPVSPRRPHPAGLPRQP
jgi:phenylpropionate dioxygenase-like ring-hydroxylating dioxygenase large terminal subunit